MKEIKRIIQAHATFEAQGLEMALATVVRISGSSYRRTGARMLIVENGTWVGGVSGGCLEGDLLKQAKQVMFNGAAKMVKYDTSEEDPYQIGVGLGCHGIIEILVVPLKKIDNLIALLTSLVNGRKEQVLLTVIHNNTSKKIVAGKTFLWQAQDFDPALQNLFGAAIATVFTQQKSRLIRHDFGDKHYIELFIEYLAPPIHLMVFGSEYDIYPLIEMTNTLGWKLTLIADLLKVRLPEQRNFDCLSNKTNYHKQIAIDGRTALLIMAHDYDKDYVCLKAFATTEIPYIGLLGPKSRGEKLLQKLTKEAVILSSAQEKRIHRPVGLDIGANIPEEIALSILGEVQAFFAKRKGGFLQLRAGTIHTEGS